MQIVCETARLRVRHFTDADTAFIQHLLNEPAFLQYIGDKQVRDTASALSYIQHGPQASYAQHGFGLNLVELKACGTPVGMCGLLQRNELDLPDLGYAFLSAHWRQGYAKEAALAVLDNAREQHGVHQVLGITLPDNIASNHLLTALGFAPHGTIALYGSENNLYLRTLQPR